MSAATLPESEVEVWAILESVPGERMSGACKDFTFRLLTANHRRLLS